MKLDTSKSITPHQDAAKVAIEQLKSLAWADADSMSENGALDRIRAAITSAYLTAWAVERDNGYREALLMQCVINGVADVLSTMTVQLNQGEELNTIIERSLQVAGEVAKVTVLNVRSYEGINLVSYEDGIHRA